MSDEFPDQRNKRGRSRDDSNYKTFRVKVTGYFKGGRSRRKTLLVPANTVQEAEARARRAVPNADSGYHFETKKVADFWREHE